MTAEACLTFMLHVAAREAVLLAVASLVALAMRRASAAQRHLVWTLAVASVLLMPAFSLLLPAWRLPALRVPLSPLAASAPVIVSEAPLPTIAPLPAPSATPAPVATMTPAATASAPPPASVNIPAPTRAPLQMDWYVPVLAMWLLGALLLALRRAIGLARLRRVVRDALPADVAWDAMVTEIAAVLRLRRPVRVRIAGVPVPMVSGVLRPVLLLPASAAQWSPACRRAVVVHELAHLRRGDCLTQWLAHLACALYWPNPLIWLAAYRLRVEREAACDDLVLAAGVPASDYAAHLLDIAAGLRAAPPPAAGIAMARTSKLGRRLQAVLTAGRNRGGVTRIMLCGCTLLAASCVLLIATLATAQLPPDMPVSMPLPTLRSTLTISPDGNHLAYVERVGARQIVVLDGQTGPAFAHIRAPWMMYDQDITLDPTTSKVPQYPRHSGLFFSPGGNHVAYVIGEWTDPGPVLWRKARVAVVRDGKPDAFYDEVSFPQFSDDGQHLAYVARNGTQWMMVVDGRAGEPFDAIDARMSWSMTPGTLREIFDPSGRVAYAGRRGSGWHVVVDGVRGPAYPRVSDLTFSPDGKRFAYVAHEVGRAFVMVDGVKQPVYQAVDGPVFSPNGRRLGYRALLPKPSRGWVVVIDGKASKPYNITFPPVFSPDSTRTAFCATEIVGDASRSFLVIDGRETSRYHRIADYKISFSPDSRQVVFTGADKDETPVTVVGNRVYRNAGYPVFSPDGSRMAIVLIDKNRHTLILDGRQMPQPEDWWFRPQTFTPDGKHLISVMGNLGWAKPGAQQGMRVVVDNAPEPLFDYLLEDMHTIIGEPGRIYFDAHDRFHYFAVKDGQVECVTHVIPQGAPTGNATDRRLQVTLRPMQGNATVTAHEPVLLRLQVTNVSGETVPFSHGLSDVRLGIAVLDPAGRLVAETGTPMRPLDDLHSITPLKPGESLATDLVLSGLHDFAATGAYRIRATLHAPYDAAAVEGTAEAAVTVRAFDREQLTGRCLLHLNAVKRNENVRLNAAALYSVRHNAVLPMLEWLVKHRRDAYAAQAIARLGTPEAQQLRRQLAGSAGTAPTMKAAEQRAATAQRWPLFIPEERIAYVGRIAASPVRDGETPVAWIDEQTGDTLFTIKDIERFDWDKQVMQLSRDRAMDLLALRVRTRGFLVRDGQGLIYRGGFSSPLTSNQPPGPTITVGAATSATAKVTPPLYRIEAGLDAARGKPDARFNDRLKAALQQAGVLGAIDPATVPPITSLRAMPEGGLIDRLGMATWAEIFPETFQLGREARVHIHFTPGRDLPPKATGVELQARITSADGTFTNTVYQHKVPLRKFGADDAFVFRLPRWWKTATATAVPGPAIVKVHVVVITDEVAGNGQYRVTPLWRSKIAETQIEIK